MLISQAYLCRHALEKLCHFRTPQFMTTTLPLSPVRRVDGAADGQEEVGTRSPSPFPSPARNLLLYPRHLVLPLILARWEPSFPCPPSGTAKPDKASTPPQSLALLPLASQEAVASQVAPEGSRIGSALWQLTLHSLGPLLHSTPSSCPLQHICPGSQCHVSPSCCSHSLALWFPACLLGTFGTSRLCGDISHLGGGQGNLYMWRV